MTNIRKYWSVVALVLVFAAGMAMRQLAPTPVQAAGPGGAPVTIQNTPLPVQGTVGVNNFPAFPATQNVKVTNTMPLPVTAADNPALQPVQGEASASADAGGDCVATFAGPGSGQRLVIEYVFVAINSHTTGTKLVDLLVEPTLNSVTINHGLAPTYVADDGAFQTWQAAQNVRLYADPNTNVSMEARGPASLHGAACYFTFSGYLVTVP